MPKNSSAALLGILGLGIGLAVVLGTSASAEPQKQTGPVPTPPGPIPPAGDKGCSMDPGIPSDIRAQVQQALSSPSLTKADYDALAQTTEAAGYPMAAACLRQRGNAVAIQQQTQVDELGGMPFVIRQGDIPYLLAQYYTGDAARFPELGSLNHQLGALTNMPSPVDPTMTISAYPGWQVGTHILIPKDWNPLAKPLPPPAQGGLPPAAVAPSPKGGVLQAVEQAAAAAGLV